MTERSLPACLQINAPVRLEMSQLANAFAQHSVPITDRHAKFLRCASIGEIWQRWWFSEADENAIETGEVVHWQLDEPKCRDFFASRIEAANTTVTTIDPQSICLLDRFRRPNTPLYEWAILGPADSYIPVHTDMFGTASWNLLLSGCKTWSFWAPESKPGASPPNITVEQTAGEVVWIPEDWWHAVNYKTASLCLSKNIVPERALARIAIAAAGCVPSLEQHLQVLLAIGKKVYG